MVSAAGLGTRSNLTNAATAKLDWSYAFEPSIAITTGRIDKLGLSIKSFREPLKKAVRDVMVKSIRTNFTEQGRPTPWEPLSDDTWHRRAGEGWSGGGALLKSGTLMKVASQQNIWTISETSATIRDLPQKIWYGKVHQAGMAQAGRSGAAGKVRRKGRGGIIIFEKATKGEYGRGHVDIPQRQFLIIQDEDREAIMRIFERWLEERVEKAMGRI